MFFIYVSITYVMKSRYSKVLIFFLLAFLFACDSQEGNNVKIDSGNLKEYSETHTNPDDNGDEKKTNPLDGVKHASLLIVSESTGCDWFKGRNHEIPKELYLREIAAKISNEILDVFPLNINVDTYKNSDRKIDSYRIIVSDDELKVDEFRLSLSLKYVCSSSNPYLEFYWETIRHPQVNAYVRTSLNRGTPEDSTPLRIPLDSASTEFNKQIRKMKFSMAFKDFGLNAPLGQ